LVRRLDCQSATSWRYARSACSASSRSRRRTSLREYAAALPFWPRREGRPAHSSSARSFLVGQRWAREHVVLVALDHRPAQHRELAGGRDHGDLHPAAGPHAFKEGAQRTRGLDRHPSGLDQHPARVGATLLGDPPVAGGLAARLLDARVDPEIGHQLLGPPEPAKVPDRCHDRQRDGGVDAGNGHQPLDFRASETRPSSASMIRSSWPWKSS